MRLVLDAHYSPRAAALLRERNYDVIAASESGELRELPDEDLLRWAHRERRVLLTENVRDFMLLHQRYLTRGETHGGILFTSPRVFPRRMDAIGHLIMALITFMDSHADIDILAGEIAWL